jgi:hypothetical protein
MKRRNNKGRFIPIVLMNDIGNKEFREEGMQSCRDRPMLSSGCVVVNKLFFGADIQTRSKYIKNIGTRKKIQIINYFLRPCGKKMVNRKVSTQRPQRNNPISEF